MSSSISIPATLPIPQRDSFSSTYEQPNSRTEMEIGAPRQRRTKSIAPKLFTLTFVMNGTQFQQFEYWYQNSIKGGSLLFDMQLLDDDNTLVWYTVNIVGEYSYANVGTAFDRWTVTMTVRSKLASFAVRNPGTSELQGVVSAGTELQGAISIPYVMRGAVYVGTELQGLLNSASMRGSISVGTDLSATLGVATTIMRGMITVDTSLQGTLAATGTNYELREDGSRELREDGSFELRE